MPNWKASLRASLEAVKQFAGEATAQIPQETIAFAQGHCVHYGEEFDNGNTCMLP